MDIIYRSTLSTGLEDPVPGGIVRTRKPVTTSLAASYGYKEVTRWYWSLSQKWFSQGPAESPQWGDGAFTRDFAGGQEAGLRERWKDI